MPNPVEPLVSVIIPNYNHARYVGDAIRSVLAQTYRNYEIIVVDDGSIDDSREVVAQFGTQVNYIYKANAGLSAARNTGFFAAAGALIGVLDADDMYEPEYLRTLVRALQNDPAAMGVYCGYQFVDHENNLLPQVESRLVDPDQLYTALLDGNFFVPESIFLRREVYEAVGLFDETLRACEDWDVWLRATGRYKIIHAPQILTRHRVLPGSMSTDPQRMLTARLAVLAKHVGADPASTGDSAAHRAYARAYLGSCVEYLQYGNPDRAYQCFQKITGIHPALLAEVDTFYQLGCGDQPKGAMGDLQSLNVRRNSRSLLAMLDRLFTDPSTPADIKIRRDAIQSTAYYSLGLLAYNTRELSVARSFLSQAIGHEPRRLLNQQVVSMWLKTLLGPRLLDRLKSRRQQAT